MSVVNKMLRDLESREHRPINEANYIPSKSPLGLWLMLIVVSTVIAFIASYSVFYVNNDTQTPGRHESSETFKIQRGDQYALANQNDAIKPPPAQAIQTVNPVTPLPLNANTLIEDKVAFLAMPKEAVLGQTEFNVTPSDGAKSLLSNLRAKAHFASQQNDEEQVIAILHEILLIAPQEMRTRKQLAALLFSKEHLASAQQVLLSGIKYAPADSSLRLMLSRIFFKTGDNQQAFSILASHPYSTLANDELVSFRAALAENIGEYSQAQKDYEILVQRNPKEAKWWLGLGVSQDKQKMNEQAISAYQQAQALNQLPQQVDIFVKQRIQFLSRRS